MRATIGRPTRSSGPATHAADRLLRSLRPGAATGQLCSHGVESRPVRTQHRRVLSGGAPRPEFNCGRESSCRTAGTLRSDPESRAATTRKDRKLVAVLIAVLQSGAAVVRAVAVDSGRAKAQAAIQRKLSVGDSTLNRLVVTGVVPADGAAAPPQTKQDNKTQGDS